MLIHLHNRTENEGNYSVYGLDEMNWLRYWMDKMPKHKTKAYGMCIPNFRGHFKDISKERSAKLDEISTKSKLEILRKSEIKIDGLVCYTDLATKLNRSPQWVMNSFKVLKIRPLRTINRMKYFDGEVINILTDYLENSAPQGRPKGSYKVK
jgi:hypothetical protein